MSCPCDKRVHPQALTIAAGLATIPRQIALFPDYRAALLAALHTKPALVAWRAREGDDLGIMLLEMWAYACDVLAFYDEVIAHEVYLRTARRRPSLRKLIGLLGYIPRPAVAAHVKLATLAEGRKMVTLPQGTGFRSGGFDGEPPQVFELDATTKIHPFTNCFALERPKPHTLAQSVQALLVESGSSNLEEGDPVLVQVEGDTTSNQVSVVSKTETHKGKDEETYQKVTFRSSLAFSSGISWKKVRLYKPARTANLWRAPSGSSGAKSLEVIDDQTLGVTLDSVYRQIKTDDLLIICVGKDHRWFGVNSNDEELVVISAAAQVETLDKDGNKVNVKAPAAKAPATKLTLSGNAKGWSGKDPAEVTVYFDLVSGATVTVEAKSQLAATDPLQAAAVLENPIEPYAPSSFLLEDKNETGAEISGNLGFGSGTLTLDQGSGWTKPLTAPVKVHGNVITASRGETVSGEILGSGDASQASQSFKLKKKPLTYLAATSTGSDSTVTSTLRVYVNGVRWTELPSFFKAKQDSEVYIVRQNDDGESLVIFGDGRHGARLPTGTNNVVAHYRYGAGAASPPAGSITQLAKPVKGLKSVRNPVAAYGGGDAESSTDLRKYAPRSALLLGRAVSIRDMEAAAARVPGVRAVAVEWRWHAKKQRPVVQVWYIGDSGTATTVAKTLRDLSDPTTPIDATTAKGKTVKLSLQIEIDDRHQDDTVLKAVRKTLTDKGTGLFSPERIGIGQPLFRSHIFETVLSVAGAVSVESITWNGDAFTSFAKKPEAGEYFDVEGGELLLNGKAA